jgi:hypothetical protein
MIGWSRDFVEFAQSLAQGQVRGQLLLRRGFLLHPDRVLRPRAMINYGSTLFQPGPTQPDPTPNAVSLLR